MKNELGQPLTNQDSLNQEIWQYIKHANRISGTTVDKTSLATMIACLLRSHVRRRHYGIIWTLQILGIKSTQSPYPRCQEEYTPCLILLQLVSNLVVM